MKNSIILPLAATVALTSCAQLASTINEPISSDYNPLDGPSAPRSRNKAFQPTGPNYATGTWVETATPNATFFRKIPKGNASADRVLSIGTPLKVIATKGSYLQVELNGGSVGFVPAIMVAAPSSSTDDRPFLPPPPSAPLQRSSSDNMAPPSVPAAPLQSSGSSLIPPPSDYNEGSSSAIPSSTPARKPSEVLIPTTAAPSLPTPSSGAGLIPAPTGADQIDQTIGIE